MELKSFTALAEAAYAEIPAEYREGIDALVVERTADRHPTLPDIYTLGMCDTESYHSDFISAETTRSRIILYYGSFQALAARDPDFDWEAEIHETLQHEVKHHLEALAGEGALEDVDYAMDEAFKRAHGLDYDPWFYQQGMPMGRGVYVVEDHVFLEEVWEPAAFEAADHVDFRWQGTDYRIPRPDELGDLHFVYLEGLGPTPPWFELVLVRRRSWMDDARRLFSSSRPHVLLSEARAEPVSPPEPGPGSGPREA